MYFNFLVDFTAFPLISVSFGIRSLYRMKFFIGVFLYCYCFCISTAKHYKFIKIDKSIQCGCVKGASRYCFKISSVQFLKLCSSISHNLRWLFQFASAYFLFPFIFFCIVNKEVRTIIKATPNICENGSIQTMIKKPKQIQFHIV